jgi:DNA invertase Pin-like site-specific DNA recombinase
MAAFAPMVGTHLGAKKVAIKYAIKGRDQRPAFDRVLKDAVRRKFDILMVWSIDRLGRSVLHVANALAELDAAGIRLYCDREGIDSSTPMGRAMIQMASVVSSLTTRTQFASI